MTYENIRPARFIDRPNRFIADIELDGCAEICHVKNTGRCRELLTPGADIFVQEFYGGARKTRFDLISVYKGERLINMDSQAPNRAFAEYVSRGAFLPDVSLLRPETRFGSSRFDFYMEAGGRRVFAEVKGVTLEENGVVLFPDAPTLRGVRHVCELSRCAGLGYRAFLIFVVQMRDVLYFTPNRRTHPEFADALREASERGVELVAYDCDVTESSMSIASPVEIRL